MSVPGIKDRTILLDGFSKTYAMTGWRMGYGVMRPDLAAHIDAADDELEFCTASFTQIAGIEAIKGDQTSVDHMRDEFQRAARCVRRRPEQDQRDSPAACRRARSTSSRTSSDGMEVEEAGRCAAGGGGSGRLSGTAFGEFGEGYLRFSVANSLENLKQALDRIDQWTKKNL